MGEFKTRYETVESLIEDLEKSALDNFSEDQYPLGPFPDAVLCLAKAIKKLHDEK